MRTIATLTLLLAAIALSAVPLSLDQARERALQANLDLQAEQADQQSARYDYYQSLFGLLPSASLTYGYTQIDPEPVGFDETTGAPLDMEDNSISYGLSASWPVFTGGAKVMGTLISRDAMLMADESLRSKRMEVIADAESKYYAVLEARDLLRNAEVDLDASRRNTSSAQMRFEAGTLSKADYLQMQSETAGKEVSLIQQRNLLEIARLDLANYLQVTADFTLEPMTLETQREMIEHLRTMSMDEVEALAATLTEHGLRTSPALQIADLGRKSSAKALWIARGSFLPTVTLTAQRSWTDDYDVDDDSDEQTTFMLNASLPIFPIADTFSAERSAERSFRQASFNLESAEDGVRLGLRSGVLNLVTAAQAAHASAIALDYAQEMYGQMEERFHSNLISASDLLSGEVLLLSSQNRYTTSVYDFLRARSALAQQMGVDDLTLSQWLQ